MKRFILIAMILSFATVLMAGKLDSVIAKVSSASTTSANTFATSSKITGWLERIDLNFANATSSVAVAVFASNDVTGITTTFLTIAAISNAASYTPRFAPQNTSGDVSAGFTNSAQRFMMLDETIYLRATNATFTGQNVQGVIMYERP